MENKKLVDFKPTKEGVYEKAENFQNIYANNAQMGVSLWDMSLIFGEVVGIENDKPKIEQKIKITMSKEFAKAVMQLLVKNIGEYEAKAGEIKLLPGIEEAANTLVASAPRKRKKAPNPKKDHALER